MHFSSEMHSNFQELFKLNQFFLLSGCRTLIQTTKAWYQRYPRHQRKAKDIQRMLQKATVLKQAKANRQELARPSRLRRVIVSLSFNWFHSYLLIFPGQYSSGQSSTWVFITFKVNNSAWLIAYALSNLHSSLINKALPRGA